jgi:hypothetical protein
MRRQRPESGGPGRAGAQRLHGPRFPPAGLGLDAKGLQAPSRETVKVSRRWSLIEKREGSSRYGEDAPPHLTEGRLREANRSDLRSTVNLLGLTYGTSRASNWFLVELLGNGRARDFIGDSCGPESHHGRDFVGTAPGERSFSQYTGQAAGRSSTQASVCHSRGWYRGLMHANGWLRKWTVCGGRIAYEV